MRHLFVGGPGRSGTSFVADRLGGHPSVAALKDIELKFFTEKNGLLDLYHALVETYSPNRAVQGLDQFRRLADALIEGRHGQFPLTSAAPSEAWRAAFDAFTARLLEEGHPVPQTAEGYLSAARELLGGVAQLTARARGLDPGSDATLFLEKTPHSLLAIGFLARLAPGARFLHVMRDPRAIALSLLAMPWGPDRLPAAARWVESYCRAWAAAEAEASALGVALLRLHIEDAVSAPGAAAAWLTARLDITPNDRLFAGASPEVLSRGAARASPEARLALDRSLGGWAAHFGYDAETIGRRLRPAFPAAAPDPAKAEPA